jgi:hypothetical protein
MNRHKLWMGAADGVLVGVLIALISWKLKQPGLWQIVTADTYWLGPSPLLWMPAAAFAGAALGAGVAHASDHSNGFLPVLARWCAMAACVAVALWVGVRAAKGRGDPPETTWAEVERVQLSECETVGEANAESISERVLRSTLLAQCAKRKGEVLEAESLGKEKHQGGAPFPDVSRAEKEHLAKKLVAKPVGTWDSNTPVSVGHALKYGEEVARKDEELKKAERASGEGSVGEPRGAGPMKPGGDGAKGNARTLDGGEGWHELTNGYKYTSIQATASADGGEDSGTQSFQVRASGPEATTAPELHPRPFKNAPPHPVPDPFIKLPIVKPDTASLTPFETVAATATCMYFGAPPAICAAAIPIINNLLGGLFGGETQIRHEDVAKLLGAFGEFAGVGGDFSDFDADEAAAFAKRFSEFNFENPGQGLNAYIKLLEELPKEAGIRFSPEGYRLALQTARDLKERQVVDVAECVKRLHGFANGKIGKEGVADFGSLLDATASALGNCRGPGASREQKAAYFQASPALPDEDIVKCSVVLAMEERGVLPKDLALECSHTRKLLQSPQIATPSSP